MDEEKHADEERSPFIDSDYSGEEFVDGDESDSDFGIIVRKKSNNFLGSVLRKKAFLCCLLVGAILFFLAFCTGLLIGHFGIPYPESHSGSTNSNSSIPTPTDCNTTNTKSIAQEICDNPPLLLISLDGFRASYFERKKTPFLDKLAAEGVRSKYMRSVYPTKTFPNHYSIATGLYPESHGIVNNAFYDTKLRDQFYIGAPDQNDPKWWKGEPIWVTAAKNDMRTGVYFWPGSAAKIQGIRPDFFYYYDDTTTFEERVNTVLKWFDYPKSTRPQFMALYFSEPDHSGHVGGPDSPLVDQALARVDASVQSLYDGLEKRGIRDCVNVMIVSDHGMGTYNESSLVYIPEYIPESLSSNVTVPTYGPISYLDTDGDPLVLQEVFDRLVTNSSELPLRVYLTQTVPYRLHAGHFNKERYGRVQLIGDIGSFISSRLGYKPVTGEHGYDNIYEEMHAIFQAHGPAFKSNYTPQAFDNIHLYSLMCGLLGISPAPNNGTTGALYHLLIPSQASQLPPTQAYPPTASQRLYRQVFVDSCPFPTNESVYNSRTFCEECVCTGEGVGCEGVTNVTIDDANRALDVMPSVANMYIQNHLPWQVPSGGAGPDSCLLTQQHYISLYSNQLHIPMWTAYKLTKQQVQGTSTPQSSCSRRDPRLLPSNSSNCTHYSPHPPFTVDVANISYASDTLIPVRMVSGLSSVGIEELSTSLLSNYIPQSQEFNTRVWKPLQNQLRKWAELYNTIHVISGVILDTNHDGHRDTDTKYRWWADGEGSVAVPTQFYTIAVRCLDEGMEPSRCDYEQLDVIGLLFQHPLSPGDPSDSLRMLKFGLTPVRDIEKIAGIDFFPLLSAQDQNTIELRIVNRLWPIT